MAPDRPVFALDIGTRSIVGLILTATEKGYHIKSAQVEEHPSRSMFHGQVHDIEAVAASVRRIKKALEKRTGLKLKEVAVAAAGRALKTSRGSSRYSPTPGQPITASQVEALELEAVREAQARLSANTAEETNQGYFCVGYSVFHYYLEGDPIANLVGQRGQEVAVEVIATFLPRVVVDGLLAVLEAADLEILTLTLEPIAALNVAVPPGMRNLNLALVDIGAGTSDIALTREGTIYAYAMVPRAGDEITEVLCSTYLLDFATGEKVKRRLGQEEEVEFTDILGNTTRLPSAQVKQALQPAVSGLAREIAAAILELNGRAPDGVILVGGGSLTPLLPQKLAEHLGLSPKRVGIRTREALPGIKGQAKKLTGPAAITPIGIGVWAFSGHPFVYQRVYVNDQPVYLWNLKGTTVADALLAAGTRWERLHPRPGHALTVEVNGQLRIIKGEMGEPARILINGKPATPTSPLQDGDRIEFEPPQNGRDASARLADLVPAGEFQAWVNDQVVPLPPLVFLNGKEVTALDTPVPDRARVEITFRQPLARLLLAQGLTEADLAAKQFPYTLAGEERVISWPTYHLAVNGKPATPETLVGPGDRVTYRKAPPAPSLRDILGEPGGELHLTLNGKPFTFPQEVTLTMNGEPATPDTPLVPGATITLQRPSPPCLADLFRYFDPRARRKGTRLVIRINGEPADFTTPLKEGDVVDIYWERDLSRERA